ncbi:hypothetical protein GCM10010964_11480 [Caldovatus sediminis]|uniref:Uncharacterized protein n=1 Tax=Caldovatus sediminis TaxID=2041189 RepID=A0A8J3EBB3_9PROT|nr:hypothetical protein GCM10010964_11480 [Caldovatus sediminis]
MGVKSVRSRIVRAADAARAGRRGAAEMGFSRPSRRCVRHACSRVRKGPLDVRPKPVAMHQHFLAAPDRAVPGSCDACGGADVPTPAPAAGAAAAAHPAVAAAGVRERRGCFHPWLCIIAR